MTSKGINESARCREELSNYITIPIVLLICRYVDLDRVLNLPLLLSFSERTRLTLFFPKKTSNRFPPCVHQLYQSRKGQERDIVYNLFCNCIKFELVA